MLSLLASTPALPLDEAGKYVAGAYVVFLVLIVIYVAIMASKLQRMERELRELASFAEQAQGSQVDGARPTAPGREVEEAVVDKSKPPTGSDRNLTSSEPVGGTAGPAQGVSDV
jgi:flagellar biosynthesis/type III secretory pathway M-ring protein FliF/YscJ